MLNFSEFNPQGFDQKRKLFGTNNFVFAHSTMKKKYNKLLTLKSSMQWYHMAESDVFSPWSHNWLAWISFFRYVFLNTEAYGVADCGKIQTRKNSGFG